MTVKNINGTSDTTCRCGSWLNHWKELSGQSIPKYCVEISCYRAPTLGAHVQKDSPTDKAWYIIPLCDTHNAKAESLEISGSVALVPANVSQTCGKRQAASYSRY
jgi:hypothetical protein